jgi:hypothetical protein
LASELPRGFSVFELDFLLLFLDHVHPFAGGLHCRGAEPCPCQQQVIVGPFEEEFGKMVHFRILQKTHGADGGERIISDNWFDVVVKVDYVGFPEA